MYIGEWDALLELFAVLPHCDKVNWLIVFFFFFFFFFLFFCFFFEIQVFVQEITFCPMTSVNNLTILVTTMKKSSGSRSLFMRTTKKNVSLISILTLFIRIMYEINLPNTQTLELHAAVRSKLYPLGCFWLIYCFSDFNATDYCRAID